MVTSNIEKLLHIRQFGGESVIRQAVEKHLAVSLLGYPAGPARRGRSCCESAVQIPVSRRWPPAESGSRKTDCPRLCGYLRCGHSPPDRWAPQRAVYL